MVKILLHILFLSHLLGNTYPGENDVISSLYIKFEWPVESSDTDWQLQFLTDDESSTNIATIQVTDEDGDGYFEYINDNSSGFFTWNTTYKWRWKVFPFGNFSDPIEFSIGPAKTNVDVTIHDENNYAEGYTIFSSADGTYSGIIDMDGNEIWNSGDQQFIYYNTDYHGTFWGAQYDESLTYQYPSVEFSIKNDIIWSEPNIRDTHHDFIQLPWGDYLGIGHEYQNGPIHANGYIQMIYQGEGYLADGITNEWPWQGDVLIIWDKETKEEKWTWAAFDHFNMVDYDTNSWNAMPNFSEPAYDWTHINALYYDETDGSIYFSSRNLDRITKIQITYDESTDVVFGGGEIIWNMGHDFPSGDATFGHNLGFSQQHSINLTEEGNIIIFDNGNYAPSYWGASAPTSRVLEIAVTGSPGNDSANIIFEYKLPENLFGSQSGNAQKLSNGNYLITTIAGDGTSYEVSTSGDLIWEATYNSTLMWRANRITTLYPIVHAENCTAGDLDTNGSWNVLDIIALADCILHASCEGCAGDLDGNGSYNVLDIIALADCILSATCDN